MFLPVFREEGKGWTVPASTVFMIWPIQLFDYIFFILHWELNRAMKRRGTSSLNCVCSWCLQAAISDQVNMKANIWKCSQEAEQMNNAAVVHSWYILWFQQLFTDSRSKSFFFLNWTPLGLAEGRFSFSNFVKTNTVKLLIMFIT